MMNEFVSIIGGSFFDPIATLLEKLEKHDKGDQPTIKAGYYENAYAISIIILAVASLESYTMRVRYMNNATGKDLDSKPVPSYLNDLYLDFPYLAEAKELFVIRDILMHNHLWEVSIDRNPNGDMSLRSSNRRSSGDRKYAENVDASTGKTKRLGLNTNPANVGQKDARTVLQWVWKVLLFLESKNRNQCYVSHLYVDYKRKMVPFGKIIGMPETVT